MAKIAATVKTEVEKIFGDGHGADVLAVVGAGRAADDAGDHVAQAVADEVAAEQVDHVALLAALLARQIVDIDVQLVHVRRGLGDGGDGDGHDGRHRRPGSLGEGEGRQGEDGAVAQLPAGSVQHCGGHLAEEVEAVAADEDQQARGRAARRRAEQQRYLAEEALQVAGEEDGGEQRHQSDDPRPVGERAGDALGGRGVGEGVAGQRQADDHRHRAGDGGGQDLLHRAAAAEADDQARGDGHKARKHDAELRLRRSVPAGRMSVASNWAICSAVPSAATMLEMAVR